MQLDSFEYAQRFVVTLRTLIHDPFPTFESEVWSQLDIVTWLLFMYCPSKMGEAVNLYLEHKENLYSWIFREFNLNRETVHLVSTSGLDDDTMDVVEDDKVVPLEQYLKSPVNFCPVSQTISFVVNKLRESMNKTHFSRLVQVSTIIYPSPYPLIRTIFASYNADWGVMFDRDPEGFCQAIQFSEILIRRCYSNRSFHL